LVFGLFGHRTRLSHERRSHQSCVLLFAGGEGSVIKRNRA
jgi:hypothetical protein